MKHALLALAALVLSSLPALAQDPNDVPDLGKKKNPSDPGGAPPPDPGYSKESIKMRWPASVADPKAALEKLFKKQRSVSDVKIDPDAREATFKFTGPIRDVKNLEAACASSKIPAKIIDPACVEFDVKPGKNAKFNELNSAIEGKVHKVLSVTGAKVEVTADLDSCAWDDFFLNASQKGFILTGKSHAFATITFSEAPGDAAEKDAAAFAGVIVVKSSDEGKTLRLIGDPKLDIAGFAKALKAKGLKIDKTTASW